MENKVKIKLNVEYIKRTTIFVFKFLFFTIFIIYIDNLKINANNVIDWHFGDWFFFRDLSFYFFSF